MKKMTITEQWDYLVCNGYVQEDTLRLLSYVYGYSQEMIDSAVYALTGYNDIYQLIESEK